MLIEDRFSNIVDSRWPIALAGYFRGGGGGGGGGLGFFPQVCMVSFFGEPGAFKT